MNMILLICEVLKMGTTKLVYQKKKKKKNRVTDVENKFMVTRGKREGDKLRDLYWHIHTTIYKIDN